MRSTKNALGLFFTIILSLAIGTVFLSNTDALAALKDENETSDTVTGSEVVGNIKDDEKLTDPSDNASATTGKDEVNPIHTHITSNTKEIEKVEPTCETIGYVIIGEFCSCGEELNRTTTEIEPLGHEYDQKTGICKRCGKKDPDFVREYSSREIIQGFEKGLITESGTTAFHTRKDDMINAFGKDHPESITVNTAASFNLWGGNDQFFSVNLSDLDFTGELRFKMCGEKGAKGDMKVDIFLDTQDFNEDPSFACTMSPVSDEQTCSIDVTNATTIAFHVQNLGSESCRLVLYDFSAKGH